jgi:hypothetical protein
MDVLTTRRRAGGAALRVRAVPEGNASAPTKNRCYTDRRLTRVDLRALTRNTAPPARRRVYRFPTSVSISRNAR